MTASKPVPVIPVLYDRILWSSANVDAFPRKHRFTVGDRLITSELALLDDLLTAQFVPASRVRASQQANLGLERLRYLFRLAKDLQCLSLREYEFAATQIVEAGRMVGGWVRHARGLAGAAPAPRVERPAQPGLNVVSKGSC